MSLMYTILYGNPIYDQYKGRSPKDLEKEYPVMGDWVMHIKKDGTMEKWMFLDTWD